MSTKSLVYSSSDGEGYKGTIKKNQAIFIATVVSTILTQIIIMIFNKKYNKKYFVLANVNYSTFEKNYLYCLYFMAAWRLLL